MNFDHLLADTFFLKYEFKFEIGFRNKNRESKIRSQDIIQDLSVFFFTCAHRHLFSVNTPQSYQISPVMFVALLTDDLRNLGRVTMYWRLLIRIFMLRFRNASIQRWIWDLFPGKNIGIFRSKIILTVSSSCQNIRLKTSHTEFRTLLWYVWF